MKTQHSHAHGDKALAHYLGMRVKSIRMAAGFLRFLLWGCLCCLMLSACFGPITLDRAVLSYNEATTDALSKQLLFNIARARHHQPIHFTAVSNIAATFNFELSAGATPALTGEDGGLLAPIFGGSVSENPTISLTPVEGEEFTKRLLAPFQENKITLLYAKGSILTCCFECWPRSFA